MRPGAKPLRLALSSLTIALGAWWSLGAFGNAGVSLPLPAGWCLVGSSRGGVLLVACVRSSGPARDRFYASLTRWRSGCTGPHARWNLWTTHGGRPLAELDFPWNSPGSARGAGFSVVGWLPVMAFGMPAALLARREGPKPGCCPRCHYDLRGLAPNIACPECGVRATTLTPSAARSSRTAPPLPAAGTR